MVALTKHWFELRYHETQAEIWRDHVVRETARFVQLVAGRGGGKTELLRRKLAISLAIKKPWPDPVYAFFYPTFQQAKRVSWEKIINLIPPEWIPKNGIHVQDLCITTVFGSKLYLVGMDKPHRVEGLQLDGGGMDECSDMRPGVFDLTVRPMLLHRDPWFWRIGVPKRNGIGRADYKMVFERGLDPEQSRYASYQWSSEDIIPEGSKEEALEDMSAQDYDEQIRANWLDLGGGIYHAFTKEKNISEAAVYEPTKPIIVGCDFNVDPMCWVLMHRIDGCFRVFDEIFIRNTNTVKTLNYLRDKYGNHKAGFRFYGDASGRARKTSASKSDYLHIKNYGGLIDSRVFFPKRNPALADRFAAVNAQLCNAKGEVHILINPKCRRLIGDMDTMAYIPGTSDPEKYDGTDIGHMADGFGYPIYRIAPLRRSRTSSAPILTEAA